MASNKIDLTKDRKRTKQNPFILGDIVRCIIPEEENEMTVIEIDGKKIVARHIDHINKRIIETKGDYKLFKRVPLQIKISGIIFS